MNAGAMFSSQKDSAFLSVIWNELDKANSLTNENDLIVDVILRSMSASDGISWRQGLQVFVQKFRKTVLPRNEESLTLFPCWSRRVKSGALSPTLSCAMARHRSYVGWYGSASSRAPELRRGPLTLGGSIS